MIEAPQAVIATLLEPVTLDRLVWSLEEQGCRCHVVRGKPTNVAWNDGLAKVTTRYAIVINDDIEVRDDFVNEIMYAHTLGATWTCGIRAEVFTNRTQEVSDALPDNRGEAFSIDMAFGLEPIPDDLQIYHGDDWFYWHHRERGLCLWSKAAEYKAEHPSFTSGSEDVEPYIQDWFGCSLDEYAREEHARARDRYFVIDDVRMHELRDRIRPTDMDVRRNFVGPVRGLK